MNATYRSEPRDVNELDFARLEAKLEKRLAEQDARMERRLAALESKMESRFHELRREMNKLEFDLMVRMLVLSVAQLLFIAVFMSVALRPR